MRDLLTLANSPDPCDSKDYIPGQRKPIGLDPNLFQQSNVLASPMVRIACNSAGAAIFNLARFGTKRIPDRRASTALIYRTFNLVSVVC